MVTGPREPAEGDDSVEQEAASSLTTIAASKALGVQEEEADPRGGILEDTETVNEATIDGRRMGVTEDTLRFRHSAAAASTGTQ